jgi:hypothetical protein
MPFLKVKLHCYWTWMKHKKFIQHYLQKWSKKFLQGMWIVQEVNSEAKTTSNSPLLCPPSAKHTSYKDKTTWSSHFNSSLFCLQEFVTAIIKCLLLYYSTFISFVKEIIKTITKISQVSFQAKEQNNKHPNKNNLNLVFPTISNFLIPRIE